MPPEVIAGRYRVEREIGRGGMGAVWLCRDELLGRVVAVKQIGRLPGESTTDLARAMREARSSAALNHRNVVSIFDAIEEDDHLWLVMEYVRGRTLAQLLADEGPLSAARAAWIGAQVADGLAAAHALGTVHRDVKPGNVLLAEDDRALISDFGIARSHGDAALTQSGMVTGTPSYFAPELARGGAPTPATDVWALGATLYAAVEGHPPYVDTEGNALTLLARIAHEPPPAPVRAGFLTEPLARMLDRDPGSRWAMADAAHALHRLHEKHAEDRTREQTAPRPAPMAAAATPAGPGTSELPATPATPATTATTATADAAGAPPTDPTEPAEPTGPPAEPAVPERRGPRALPLLLGLLVVVVVAAGLAWWLSGNNGDPGGSAAPPATGRSDKPSHTKPSHTKPSHSGPSHSSSPSSASPSPSASTSSSPSASATAPAAHSMLAFPRSYYGVLPDDTRAGWQMLSPGYRSSLGYGSYRGFWNSISAVSVGRVTRAGSDAVDVHLTYAKSNGSTSSETRRLYLERSGDGWLITSDRVVG